MISWLKDKFLLAKAVIQYRFKLGDYYLYCPKCQACGYIECCPAKQCTGGFGCADYYTPGELDGTENCEDTSDY